MAVGRGTWCCAALSWLLLCGAAQAFEDGGDRSSLIAALEGARIALPSSASQSRRLLDALTTALRRGRSVGDAIDENARRRAATEILLTGYYEPLLTARRRRSQEFRFPLYRVPDDAGSRTLPRQEIDAGALAGRGLEIFWVADPIESFFLHVQGSGRLGLGDGRTARVGYAGNNGHTYHSIGSELVSRGAMTVKEATAPAIKEWLRDRPEKTFEILHTNPRYIFFREVEGPDDVGPVGAMGAALVAFRSVATDPAVVPMGTVGLLTAPLPDGATLRRVVVAMDKGAAIRGERRVDLFTGAGAAAEALAGVLRARSQIIWLE